MMLYILLFNLIITGLWCQDIERVVVPQGQPFSFDCQSDESVYFGRRLNEWTEIEENNENNLYLNLNFRYITKENILRVTSDSAESKHAGFYACRKSTWTSTSMNSIYQLILADVQSFYWNYICHASVGSCQRSNDITDENLSRFEVADQTNIELFCCASVTGYKKVNIHMNDIGDNRGNVEVNKKEEVDGSWVICANQRTILKRTSFNKQQTLTCELLIDDRHYSTLSSIIIIKDATQTDLLTNYNSYSDRNPNDHEYFNKYVSVVGRSRRKLTTGKKIAIIIGSIFAGLILLGILSILIILRCRNKKNSTSSNTRDSKPYLPVQTSDGLRYINQPNIKDEESAYEEPTPLSESAPVFMRC